MQRMTEGEELKLRQLAREVAGSLGLPAQPVLKPPPAPPSASFSGTCCSQSTLAASSSKDGGAWRAGAAGGR